MGLHREAESTSMEFATLQRDVHANGKVPKIVIGLW